MDDAYRQRAQPAHRPDVVRDIGMAELVEQRPVIDRVAREQRACPSLKEADAARRMARQVQDLETAVADIDDAAFLDDPRRRRWAEAIAREVIARMRQRSDEILVHRIAGL